MEYAAPVWSPHHSKDINKLQKFVFRMCSKDWKANDHDDLLDHYETPNLAAELDQPAINLKCQYNIIYTNKFMGLA